MAADYQGFKNYWNGRRVDYDHVYAYQCVDLVLQWCKDNGFPNGIWGNAIDYANAPTVTFSNNFVRVTDGSRKAGDIVVLRGMPGNPYGHIGLVDTDTNKFLEQNGVGGSTGTGRDAIGVYRNIPQDRVVAVYRLKQATPPPPPAPARQEVFLPSSVQSWRLYRVGSYLRPNTTDQIAVLAPAQFPPGLTYKIEAWVGDYAVVIQTQMFGRGVIWVKGTEAQIR
jgi:hypothetical protein